ncbi:MAG: hypothetical protein ACOCV2_04680 [Persicimonas sp.]
MSNNHRPDPFRDLFDDQELSSLFDEEEEGEEFAGEEFDDEELEACPGCSGKGRYVGLFKIEDPCERCGGTGTIHHSSSHDDRTPLPPSAS